jgi:hypothetical protein
MVFGGGGSQLGATNIAQRANLVGESAGGAAGEAHGGGGNGGFALNGGAAQAGGSGANGIVIVEVFA